MEGQPLLGVLRGLILDDGAQAEFTADPSGYMQRAGYDDISEEDLSEAVSLVADTLPPDVAHAVSTAAAPPDGGGDDGGALGMLGRLAEIDPGEIAPLEVPEPMSDYPPDDGLGWGVDDGSPDSFGDIDQDFDEPLDPFAEEGAEPDLAPGEHVPLSEAHNVDDDPVDIDVDVDPAGDDALGFGEGSSAPDMAAERGAAGPGDGEAGDGLGDEQLDDAFGADAFGSEGDSAALDDAASALDAPDAYDDDYDGGEAHDATDPDGDDQVDDQGEGPDIEGDDVGFF